MHFPEDHVGDCRLRFFIANGGDTDATVIGYVAYLYNVEDGVVFAPEAVDETPFVYMTDVVLKPGARVEIIGSHLFKWATYKASEQTFALGRVEYEGADESRDNNWVLPRVRERDL